LWAVFVRVEGFEDGMRETLAFSLKKSYSKEFDGLAVCLGQHRECKPHGHEEGGFDKAGKDQTIAETTGKQSKVEQSRADRT